MPASEASSADRFALEIKDKKNRPAEMSVLLYKLCLQLFQKKIVTN